MADLEKLERALVNADSAGDVAAAKALAAAVRAARAAQPDLNWRDQPLPEGFVMNPTTGQAEDMRSPVNPNVPTGIGASAMIGAGDGLGFGAFDETAGAIGGATGRGYEYEMERARETGRRARSDHPLAYYPPAIAGAIASALGGGRALGVKATGNTLSQTMARGGAIGGTEGGIFGFNSGEGLADRLKGAALGAGLGGPLGAIAPALSTLGAKAGRGILDMAAGGVDAATDRASQGRATRSIADVLRKSGRSADDIARDVMRAAQDGQPDFRLMDATGQAGQRRVSGIVRDGGDGAEELAQFLNQRQLDQPSRVAGFVDDAFSMRGTTAEQTRSGLKQARGTAADAAYGAARSDAGAVNLTPTLGTIDDLLRRDPILGDSALARTEIGNRLIRLRKQMQEGGEQLIDFDRVLNIKQDMFAVMEGLRKSGKSVPVEMSQVYKSLDRALEASSAGYRAANDGFRAASKVIGAVDEGAAMATKNRRFEDTVPAFRRMLTKEQAAARIGYGDNALARIEASASPTANVAKPFGSTKVKAEVKAMAYAPEVFADRIARENSMWSTANRALGGSRTADNLSDIADVGLLADATRAARGGVSGVLDVAAQRLGPALTGQNAATRTLIARAMMSDDPLKVLAPALKYQGSADARARVADALIRAMERESSQIAR